MSNESKPEEHDLVLGHTTFAAVWKETGKVVQNGESEAISNYRGSCELVVKTAGQSVRDAFLCGKIEIIPVKIVRA